jgi:hypothetical protein
VTIFRDLIAGGFEGESAERASEASEVPVDLFGMTAAVLKMMAQCGKARAKCVQEPVVRHIESGGAEFKAAGTEPHASGCGDLFIDGLRQVVKKHDQAFTRTDSQAWRNKVGVTGESSSAIAQDTGYGKGDCAFR